MPGYDNGIQCSVDIFCIKELACFWFHLMCSHDREYLGDRSLCIQTGIQNAKRETMIVEKRGAKPKVSGEFLALVTTDCLQMEGLFYFIIYFNNVRTAEQLCSL